MNIDSVGGRCQAGPPAFFAALALRTVLPKQQSLLIVHDAEPDQIKPSPATDERVRRAAHRVEENDRGPFQPERLNRNFVPVSLERTGPVRYSLWIPESVIPRMSA